VLPDRIEKSSVSGSGGSGIPMIVAGSRHIPAKIFDFDVRREGLVETGGYALFKNRLRAPAIRHERGSIVLQFAQFGTLSGVGSDIPASVRPARSRSFG
jgi:hypothetical protein